MNKIMTSNDLSKLSAVELGTLHRQIREGFLKAADEGKLAEAHLLDPKKMAKTLDRIFATLGADHHAGAVRKVEQIKVFMTRRANFVAEYDKHLETLEPELRLDVDPKVHNALFNFYYLPTTHDDDYKSIDYLTLSEYMVRAQEYLDLVNEGLIATFQKVRKFKAAKSRLEFDRAEWVNEFVKNYDTTVGAYLESVREDV